MSFKHASKKSGPEHSFRLSKRKNVAKVSKVWKKEARAEPNHSHHYIEIAFTPHQHLSSNDTPEDFNQPAFFHVQCNLAFPALVNGRFLNCLCTVETNKMKHINTCIILFPNIYSMYQ